MEKILDILQGTMVALPLILFFLAPIVVFVLVCLAILNSLSKPKRSHKTTQDASIEKLSHDLESSSQPEMSCEAPVSSRLAYQYQAKNHIMTRREEKFFLTLCEIFKDKCYIIPQVHLSSLLEHRIKGQNWKGAFSHINGKSVDYVLLHSRDLSVLCAVELDDSTHDRTERVERDREVGWILGLADIPLVRLRTPEKMSKQDIVDSFAQIINKVNK